MQCDSVNDRVTLAITLAITLANPADTNTNTHTHTLTPIVLLGVFRTAVANHYGYNTPRRAHQHTHYMATTYANGGVWEGATTTCDVGDFLDGHWK